MIRSAILGALLSGFAAHAAAADAGWFEAGDMVLRTDLALLNDAGVIRLPINQWPMPRAAVRYAIEHDRAHLATNAAVSMALSRVQARLDAASRSRERGWSLEVGVTAGEDGRLRDFETPGRENGGLSVRGAYAFADRAEVSLNFTGSANPEDDQSLRGDGSHVTFQLGNWLLSAHTLDRWWGPGHEGSLILSNNARPMPTLMLERATARPFQTPWLSWLGPWRASFGMSRMESERQDIDAPLFMAWRVTIMPFKDIELGVSRTAQFCGKQQECKFSTFTNLLVGHDNVGFDATLQNEPGNQMAGFDVRWNSPIGNLPYALYAQMIGEDESHFLPVKYLAQFGIEYWKPLARGGLIQTYVEYADNTCSASRDPPQFDCAYTQRQFDVEGYRYRGRVIGQTADNDAEMRAFGATFIRESGDSWSAVVRSGRLNRGGSAPDVRNTVSAVPATYRALELGWRGYFRGEKVLFDLGAQSVEPDAGKRQTDVFGFIGWRHELRP